MEGLSVSNQIGIIGGTGWMGKAMAQQWLRKNLVRPQQLWLSNRSGHLENRHELAGVQVTADNHALVQACSILILAVRPKDFPQLNLPVTNQLVLSIMAGVNIQAIQKHLGTTRVVRTMPNAAVELGLSYTPWYADTSLTPDDKAQVRELLQAFGSEEELANEDQLAFFTALTGSGHGLLAYMANAMVQAALRQGIAEPIAERAIRQLFVGVGQLLGQESNSPAVTVERLIEYAGTTAAGLLGLRQAGLDQAIEKGIQAAYRKAASDMT